MSQCVVSLNDWVLFFYKPFCLKYTNYIALLLRPSSHKPSGSQTFWFSVLLLLLSVSLSLSLSLSLNRNWNFKGNEGGGIFERRISSHSIHVFNTWCAPSVVELENVMDGVIEVSACAAAAGAAKINNKGKEERRRGNGEERKRGASRQPLWRPSGSETPCAPSSPDL